jgi:hypothetical protein
MAKYTIGKVEDTGKFKKINVKDEAGVITERVSAWPDYSQYEKIATGAVVEGVLFVNGKYTNLKDGNLGPRPASFGGGAKNMEVKAQNISKAMDRKESGIEISATARDATLVLTTFYKDLTDEQIKSKWLYWRRWFLNNFNNTTTSDMSRGQDLVPPFNRTEEEEGIDLSQIPF